MALLARLPAVFFRSFRFFHVMSGVFMRMREMCRPECYDGAQNPSDRNLGSFSTCEIGLC